jgi:hypothetical protein
LFLDTHGHLPQIYSVGEAIAVLGGDKLANIPMIATGVAVVLPV